MLGHRETIPQKNPKASYLAHREEIDAAIARILNSGSYILGQEVAAFEEKFAAYIGVRYAIGVASGTDALHLALRACRIGPGDAVITVSHTAVATVAAINMAGATPILVDIDPVVFTMEPNSLESAIQNLVRHSSSVSLRPKAVIPVHIYGHPVDMPAIMEIAQRYNLYVIEDCAQSHGATLFGRKTGTWGHMAAFSFYPTKSLGALGDGGMVVSGDGQLAEQVRLLRQYGWQERYVSHVSGMNSRLDEVQAAILGVKLKYLDQENARCRQLGSLYDSLLRNGSLALPSASPGASHIYHQYVVSIGGRDALSGYLRERGISTAVHYPVPVHLQPAYRRLPSVISLDQTTAAVQRILSLPMYPELVDAQVRTVADHIEAWEQGESRLS